MGYFEDRPNFQFKLYRYLSISTNKVTTPKENQVHRPPWEEGIWFPPPPPSPIFPISFFLLPFSSLIRLKPPLWKPYLLLWRPYPTQVTFVPCSTALSSLPLLSTICSLPPLSIHNLTSSPFFKFWDLIFYQNQICLFQEAPTLHAPPHQASGSCSYKMPPTPPSSDHHTLERVQHVPTHEDYIPASIAGMWFTRSNCQLLPCRLSPPHPPTMLRFLCIFLVFIL
jgi:hypothetical protein